MALFNEQEQELITSAISDAEKQTSGEIRIAIDKHCKGDVFEVATAYFKKLGMDKTSHHNGVLIYLAHVDHKFAIIGDRGIHKVVPEDFWETTQIAMKAHFASGNLVQGIIAGISLVAEKLALFFPYQTGDINELPNEIRSLLIFLLTVFFIPVFAQDFPAKPNKLVNDFTGTLTAAQTQQLEDKLVAFDDSTSIQIAIAVIKSVGDYDINDYALQLGRKWGVGSKKNTGVMIVVALGDRKISIQSGYGIEGALPDMYTRRIIENDIKPYFKAGNYYAGLESGTNAIISFTKGEYKNDNPKKAKVENNGGGSGGSQVMGSRGVADVLFWSMLFGGGRGSGGSGWGSGGGSGDGGGFGGFGGGSFGGGGSSGSW
eukprot:gene12718-14927_t